MIFFRDVAEGAKQSVRITEAQLKGRNRTVAMSAARDAFAVVCRDFGFSDKEIAAWLKRDRSTISHALKKARAKSERLPAYRKIIEEIRAGALRASNIRRPIVVGSLSLRDVERFFG